MQALIVLVAMVWLMSLPWWAAFMLVAVPASAAVVGWWLYVRPQLRFQSPGPRQQDVDPDYVNALEEHFAKAETEIERLREQVQHLKVAADRPAEPLHAVLYRRVGLSPSAPFWLIVAAQRAYRAQLHPDRHPPQHKVEAETRFKAAEATFAEIAVLSGR